jgi:hypothetical protein
VCGGGGRVSSEFNYFGRPKQFRQPNGEKLDSSLIFGGVFLQFLVIVNGPVKIGYIFWWPT